MEQAPPVLSQQPTKTSEQEGDTRQWREEGVWEDCAMVLLTEHRLEAASWQLFNHLI